MKRKERHHLKENELVHTIETTRDFLKSHKRQIAGGLVGIVLLGVIVAGVVLFRQRTQSQGAEQLAEAMVALNAPVVPAGAQSTGEDIPAAASLGAAGSCATEEAKLTAAWRKLQAAADAYPDSGAGITARYHLAGALAALGRHED